MHFQTSQSLCKVLFTIPSRYFRPNGLQSILSLEKKTTSNLIDNHKQTNSHLKNLTEYLIKQISHIPENFGLYKLLKKRTFYFDQKFSHNISFYSCAATWKNPVGGATITNMLKFYFYLIPDHFLSTFY